MKRAYTIERNELIVDLYKKGKTVAEISADMKLCKEHIRRILVENEVVERGPFRERISAEKAALIADMIRRGGLSREEIANAAGCSRKTVSHYAKKLGYSNIHKTYTTEQIEEMRRLRYEEGLNNAAIAERLGANALTVTRHIGTQPAEMTEIYKVAGARIRGITQTAQRKAKIAMRKLALEEKRKAEEAARLEAERIEKERIEALRLAKENEIKELLAELNIPCENFTIDSAENGDAFLNNLISRATEKLSVGA